MKIKKVPVNYVDNGKFYQTIVEHRQRVKEALEQGKEPPRLPDYIGDCILKIAKNLATMPKFMNYSYKEEMISDGIENCILYFDDFDHVKYKNPFAYFTQVIYFAFLRRIKREEKIRYTMYKHFQETTIQTGLSTFMTDSDDNNLIPKELYDNIQLFMASFEEKEAIKKEKRKAMKQGLEKFYEEEVVDSKEQ